MNAVEQTSLFDDLQGLLEKQIEMARRSNFRQVEQLAEQADSIVEKIAKTKEFEQPEFNDRREHLTKLYEKLQLILATGKESVARQLQQIGSGRKTLQAYRNNS